MKKLTLTAIASVFLTVCLATDPYPKNEAIDVQHYVFRLDLNDSTNHIVGEASITIQFRKALTAFELDLLEKGPKGFGMTVTEVLTSTHSLAFAHAGGRLHITLAPATSAGETRTFLIRYHGIPEDGLIIGTNKFGDRGFFGDNWPDRGHQWLPCIDHPSDKATVEFAIMAPDKYQVVATGKRIEESNFPRGQKLTRYRESAPVAVKVMTIGVARFAVEETADVDHIPQSTWVYPQNREAGFHDFAVGVKVFGFFHTNIGPYAFEKLAHVQSKTRWGGLENAGNIFYMEGAVTGKNQHEGLIAHETAHQWFGNSVTENDWHHVWLSEGFATYFASLYTEFAHGQQPFAEEMKNSRQSVVKYFAKNQKPIVDTTIVNIGQVLSTNTYQKAGWVLHMLRMKIGDDAFWKGIKNYYAIYKNKNALTADFRKVMEEASGSDLRDFFQQWFYRGGHPQLNLSWTYSKSKKMIQMEVRQRQATPFQFPLDVEVSYADGTTMTKTFPVGGALEIIQIPAATKPKSIQLDPGTRLLFEAEMKER